MRISDWSSDVCSSDLGLRSYASINVRSAEVLDTHAFAVLVGVGATTVHAYLAEAAIADRQSRGLFGELSLDECRLRFRKAIDDGLLKILAKMGIAVISSYRGGYNFEAVGLSRALVLDLFPGMRAEGRESVGEGKSGEVRGDLGGGRNTKK